MSTDSRLQRLRDSVTVKLLFAGFLLVVLLIPLTLVGGLVSERQYRHDMVIHEIGETWGRPQTLAGPVLVLPYDSYWKDEKGNTHRKRHLFQLLPETLDIDGEVATEIRHRGIFEAVVYRLKLSLSGRFQHPDPSSAKIPLENVLWEEAYLTLGVSDTRGIREQLTLQWNGHPLEFLAGTGPHEHFEHGLHLPLPLSPQPPTEEGGHQFSLELNLNGNDNIMFVPVGKKTTVNLQAPWPDPSFMGEFLPVSHDITDRDFRAKWEISYLARGYPQQWQDQVEGMSGEMRQSAFGVRLLIPVDFYQKTERSVKYGGLFLLLTFLGFFLFEVFNPLRIHALQYLLVGSALVMFYLLLLSFSEHIGFTPAYLLATVATVGLIGGYSASVLQSGHRARWLSLALGILYFYLYILLHLQDYALLLGSLGLFAILAGVMYATRDVDWYGVGQRDENENQEQA